MNIVFADDHDLIREAIKPFLQRLGDEVTIFEAGDFDHAVDSVINTPDLDLILLDLDMPGMNGLTGIERMAQKSPDVPIVILSGHINRQDVFDALEKGASGYISKTTKGSALINALQLVLAGEKYLPASVLSENSSQAPSLGDQPGESPLFNKLSKRENDVLRGVVDGKTNKEIARQLDLDDMTIKVHVRSVYRKLGVSNRAQAVRLATQNGW